MPLGEEMWLSRVIEKVTHGSLGGRRRRPTQPIPVLHRSTDVGGAPPSYPATRVTNGSRARLVARSAFALCAALIASALYLGFARRTGAAVEGGEFGAQDVLFYLSDFAFVGIGALVASRRSDNRVGWFFIAAGTVGAVADFGEQWSLTAFTDASSLPLGPEAAWVYGSFSFAIAGFLALAVLYFPTGRLPSPAWRWVALLAASGIALSMVNAALLWPFRGPALLEDPVEVPGSADLFGNVGLVILIVTAFGASVISLLVRFRRARTQERQQIKWLAYAASLVLMVLLVGFVPGFLTRSGPSIPAELAGSFAILAMPTAAGIAILRHRLFDIDVIIRQSLVYGALTILLTLIYFGGAVLFQLVLSPRPQQSDIAIVGSTLAVAALFRPVRARVQGSIDRRFYRPKYDAANMLEAFKAKLREEVDLDALSAELLAVVGNTMQPADLSLWLRSPNKSVLVHAETVRRSPAGGEIIPMSTRDHPGAS
jgi:hypothetical protein